MPLTQIVSVKKKNPQLKIKSIRLKFKMQTNFWESYEPV